MLQCKNFSFKLIKDVAPFRKLEFSKKKFFHYSFPFNSNPDDHSVIKHCFRSLSNSRRLMMFSSIGITFLSRKFNHMSSLISYDSMDVSESVIKKSDSIDIRRWYKLIMKKYVYFISAKGLEELCNTFNSRVANDIQSYLMLNQLKNYYNINSSVTKKYNSNEYLSKHLNASSALSTLYKTTQSSILPFLIDIYYHGNKLKSLDKKEIRNVARITLGLYMFFSFIYGDTRVKYRYNYLKYQNFLNGTLQEIYSLSELVKGLNHQKTLNKKVQANIETCNKSSLYVTDSLALLNFGQACIINSGIMFSNLILLKDILKGQRNHKDMIKLNEAYNSLSFRLRYVATIYRNMKLAYKDFVILKNEISLSESKDDKNLEPLKINEGSIVFRNLNYAYNEGQDVLKNFNLTIPGKSKIALIGYSGSGKSTILNLVIRLFKPNTGEIKICNQNILDVTAESLRSAISFVPQNVTLFNDTLRNNILVGVENKETITDEFLMDRIKKFGLINLVERIGGIDVSVGEYGSSLSSGERQKIALLRAYLKNASIVLLDEPTAHLDLVSETEIVKILREHLKDKTVIWVSHKLPTITWVDEIIVLKEGNIVERGNHKNLISKKGIYYNIWTSRTKLNDSNNNEQINYAGELAQTSYQCCQ